MSQDSLGGAVKLLQQKQLLASSSAGGSAPQAVVLPAPAALWNYPAAAEAASSKQPTEEEHTDPPDLEPVLVKGRISDGAQQHPTSTLVQAATVEVFSLIFSLSALSYLVLE